MTPNTESGVSLMPKIRRDKRDVEITIRVNEEELAELKKRQQGTTMAGWMRGLGLGVTPMKPADPELVRTLGRIGSNLNQLTKHANTNKALDQGIFDQISAIRASIDALLDDNLRDEE